MSAAAILGVMKAAAALPSVKAVVLTSSSNTAHKEQNGKTERYTLDTYKEYMFPIARNIPLTEPTRPFVYCEYTVACYTAMNGSRTRACLRCGHEGLR